MHVYMAVEAAPRDEAGTFAHREGAEFNYRGEADPEAGDDPVAFKTRMAGRGHEVVLTKEHRGDVLRFEAGGFVTKHGKVVRRPGRKLEVEG